MINSITFVALVATVASAKNQNTITLAPRDDTASAGSEVPAFGQCGGQSYTGLTNCGLGYQCVYQNDYYSQCIAIDYSREQYAQRWEQCHGINYNGPTDCVPGFTCSIQNDYFGGCRPGTATGLITSKSSSTTTSSSTTAVDVNAIPRYGQCGGKNHVGSTTCVSGSYCKFFNDWYSQCVANEENIDTTGTTTVSTSSTSTTTEIPVEEPTTTTEAPTTTSTTTPTTEQTTTTTSTSSTTGSTPTSELEVIPGGFSGSGKTTRYWDCCLPSFSWNGKSSKVPNGQTVRACDAQGNVFSGYNFQSGCIGGNAFMCTDQQPWAVTGNLAYGFAAASVVGANDESLACSCFKLTFTDTSIAGKEYVVQITNTGGDLGANHFDLALPGGGFGIFTAGCPKQFGSGYYWGETYGGLSSANQCQGIPASLEEGCDFRFNWFENADNPSVSFQQVVCPAEIIAKSGCSRTDQ